MKITNKQRQEIEFLTKHFCRGNKPTDADIDDYIMSTVYGKANTKDKMSSNVLRNAKQRLDIQVKLWREDLACGIISKHELLDDFNCEYANNLIASILKSITPDYRRKILQRNKAKSIMAITNFDDLISSLVK